MGRIACQADECLRTYPGDAVAECEECGDLVCDSHRHKIDDEDLCPACNEERRAAAAEEAVVAWPSGLEVAP